MNAIKWALGYSHSVPEDKHAERLREADARMDRHEERLDQVDERVKMADWETYGYRRPRRQDHQ